MVDRFIFGVVIVTAFVLLFLVLPILVRTLWDTRDLPGFGKAILIKLIIGDLWMLGFLGYLMANRLWKLGGLSDYILVPLAVILLWRPALFWVWFQHWTRQVKKECNDRE